MCKYIVELLERTEDNGLRQRFIKADVVSTPRNKNVVYFCIFNKDSKHDFNNIKSVVKWGGISGFFFKRMMTSKNEKEIEQIKQKRVIL